MEKLCVYLIGPYVIRRKGRIEKLNLKAVTNIYLVTVLLEITQYDDKNLYNENLPTEEWFFKLVDAKNAFNKINRVGMLCTVQHLWPYRARFVFNYYRYWSLLVLQNCNVF